MTATTETAALEDQGEHGRRNGWLTAGLLLSPFLVLLVLRGALPDWAVTVPDVLSGIAKTCVFGWIIAMVGCFQAFATTGGTAGVGRATTNAVVIASISVLVSDFFLTKLMMIL